MKINCPRQNKSQLHFRRWKGWTFLRCGLFSNSSDQISTRSLNSSFIEIDRNNATMIDGNRSMFFCICLNQISFFFLQKIVLNLSVCPNKKFINSFHLFWHLRSFSYVAKSINDVSLFTVALLWLQKTRIICKTISINFLLSVLLDICFVTSLLDKCE